MNIGGIGTPYIDYSRYTAGQQNQKQETAELAEEKQVTVRETEQSPESGSKNPEPARRRPGTVPRRCLRRPPKWRSSLSLQAATMTTAIKL